MMRTFALIIVLVTPFVIMGMMIFHSDWFTIALARLRGIPIVECQRMGETWKTPVFTDPFGVRKGWRYPGLKIGEVILHPGGAGSFHGVVHWESA